MRSANDVLLYGLSQRSFYHAGKFVDAATAAKVCFYLYLRFIESIPSLSLIK